MQNSRLSVMYGMDHDLHRNIMIKNITNKMPLETEKSLYQLTTKKMNKVYCNHAAQFQQDQRKR